MIRYLITAVTLCFIANIALAGEQKTNVAVQRISTNVAGIEISVRVFYPSATESTPTQFGVWELSLSKDAEPISGTYPLIMISHGLGGNEWNHHLLAKRLVETGFIVAAVHHPNDLLRIGRPEHAVLRPLELRSSLDAVLANNTFGSMVDQNNIGAFGFSAGGYTVLSSAGGLSDRNRILQHCLTPEHDPEFCLGEEGGKPLPQWLQIRRNLYSMPKIDIDQSLYDHRIKALAVVAPVGLPFYDLTRVTQPIILIRAGADQILRYPYHAENIHELLPTEHIYKVIDGLYHYAFLSPFPAKIASEVGEPAIDPKGFDRQKFLDEVNTEIANFFLDELQ